MTERRGRREERRGRRERGGGMTETYIVKQRV
jgi:hypothetical protein